MKPDTITKGADSSPLETVNQEELDLIPNFKVIPVTLTFEGYPPLKFQFRRQQSKEVKDAKQAFYALTEEEQDQTLHSYRVGILADLLEKRPVGVPDFPEGDFKDAFKVYFNDPDNEEMLQWIWGQYQGKLYPKELLSSPLD